VENDHQVTINDSDTSFMSLVSLGTFETISVPFLLRNLKREQRTLLFRVAIDGVRHYYVHERIDLVNGESSLEQLVQK
jgi:hypothetical protein